MGIGAALLNNVGNYTEYGWGIVKQLNYDPNLALQVQWSNINQAAQNIVDAACNQK